MLINEIEKMRLNARKNKSEDLEALTYLFSEAKKIGKDDGNREPSDQEIINLCKKLKQSFLETIEQLKSTNNLDRVTKIEQEIKTYEYFIPKQLDTLELKNHIQLFIKNNPNQKQIGLIMKYLKENFGSNFDAKIASQIIKEEI